MVGIAELKEYHALNKKALEIHQQWGYLDAIELLPLAISLREVAMPLSAVGGDDWYRKGKMTSHLNCLVSYLKENKKEQCWTDIKDLIYADLPALGFRLLALAGTEAKSLA